MPGISLRTALRRFEGYQGSGEGFRRHQRSVKRGLMSTWQVVMSGQSRILGADYA
jgi:hypothetical protein